MPALGTRGGASARGFGLFGFKQSFIQGSYGLFNLGNRTAVTMKYAWAPDTVGYGRSFTAQPQAGFAAGNATMGIFALNLNSTGAHQATQKYVHASDTTGAGANLTNGCFYGFATGNATLGIFFAGGFDASTPKAQTTAYTYSSDSCAAGGNMVVGVLSGCAVGNDTFAIINRAGRSGNSALNDSYTYATAVSATATAFPVTRGTSRYFGNATLGIFQGTNLDAQTTQRYIWASNTTQAGTSIGQFAFYTQGCGNADFAIAPGDSLSSTVKYVYATNTNVTGLAFLPDLPFQGGSTNNGLAGVNA